MARFVWVVQHRRKKIDEHDRVLFFLFIYLLLLFFFCGRVEEKRSGRVWDDMDLFGWSNTEEKKVMKLVIELKEV